jgi:hypothetical protein
MTPEKPALQVLSKTFSMLPDAEGKPQPHTYVTFRDENGMIGFVMILKKDPSEADIREAVKKQREQQKAQKPQIIAL